VGLNADGIYVYDGTEAGRYKVRLNLLTTAITTVVQAIKARLVALEAGQSAKFRRTRGAALSVTNATWTTITGYDGTPIALDEFTEASGVFTATRGGVYLLTGSAEISIAGATYYGNLRVTLNGTATVLVSGGTSVSNGTAFPWPVLNEIVRLAAGDTIRLQIKQETTATRNIGSMSFGAVLVAD